jgi:hypothetical protein
MIGIIAVRLVYLIMARCSAGLRSCSKRGRPGVVALVGGTRDRFGALTQG